MFLDIIQHSELALWLRQSLWLYPVVNTLHIFGFALLLGTTMTLDFRLLGLWSKTPLFVLVQVLRPVMITGFLLASVFGALLFVTGAADYLKSSLFITKMVFVCLALGNALVLSRSSCWRMALFDNHRSVRLKGQALLSLLLWLVVLFLGRFIGFR